MKKYFAILILVICAAGIAACGAQKPSGSDSHGVDSVEGANTHKIGVIVYNNADDEVVSFRHYLENYIEEVFPGVTFLYSGNITSEEEELAFIQNACDEGVDGFLSFLTIDLSRELDLCAKNKVYYILASGTTSEDDFEAVADNPWFLGEVGPGTDLEYQTGMAMADHFVNQGFGDRYFILSGGGSMGNEMHRLRTMGILDRLQETYGVTLDKTSEEIAESADPVRLTAGNLTVCVVPGYISRDEFFGTAREEYKKDQYDVVLSVLPVANMADVVKGTHLGVVDCFSERNLQLFNRGELSYVAGKYSSLIGPSFAAMYNAVTGYAEDFRDNGKAFQLKQGFWYSVDRKDYEGKYSLANSVVTNAYNYEDLGKVCKVLNPDATLADLESLAGAYSYEEAKKRRGIK
jgi:hypothetical protein